MIPYGDDPGPRAGAARTPRGDPGWRSWHGAWREAAYGVDGFWTRERPRDHFATGVGVGTLVARAVADLVPEGVTVVVDVGAGDGSLLTALVDLLPGVALVGVDRRARPSGLDPRVGWSVDHWDTDAGRWLGGGPERWYGSGSSPLLVAHEWLDDLPVPVVERTSDGWREVEVDAAGGERLGPVVPGADKAWLDRWWDAAPGDRAEVGRARDVAWSHLVTAALTAPGGRALAVDYGHRHPERPAGGSLVAYAGGRQRRPRADGSVNLTAGVAVDALAAAGEALGATTVLLRRQSAQLDRLPTDTTGTGAGDPLGALVRRSERAALTDPARWGGLWWLLQGHGARAGAL